jgi:hypothetical protein
MKTYRRVVRKSHRQPRVRSRAHHDASALRNNGFLKAGLLFMFIGLCMLVFQTLTDGHHAAQLVLREQPKRGTPVEYSHALTHSPVSTEGAVPILVGCALIGLGSALKGRSAI